MMKKKSKMYAAGGKLKMVEGKDGKEVPFFAADGKGKMAGGGMTPKTKGYFKGGKTKGYSKGGKVEVGGTTKMKSGGMCRGGGAATRGMKTSKKMG